MERKSFNFYEANNVYGDLFFQFPKVLIYGKTYKNLSAEAKLAYMVLKDRLEYSLKNQWVDEDNKVYFIFTNNELQKLFNCSEHKVIKIKKELEKVNLLFQQKMGFDPKQKRNLPNRLYLAQLNVTAQDVYLKQKTSDEAEPFGINGTAKNAARQKNIVSSKSSGTSGTAKNAARQKKPESVDTNGTAKNAVNQDKDILRFTRYNIDTAELDFSTTNYSTQKIENQNQDLVTNAKDFLTLDSGDQVPLEPEAIQLLSFWVRTPQQMRKVIGIILNARRDMEKEHQNIGMHFLLDDEELQHRLTLSLRRYFNAIRSNEKNVKNYENYLYGTMRNMFGDYWNIKKHEEFIEEHPDLEERQNFLTHALLEHNQTNNS
ncbi:replication initiator protein A [Ligilactobacillus acidipiscis]|nr:replication initiator protein A [Ligilactobacillus acidipiscis]GAW63336.1 replication protein RepA [Ligilactobacillus acidipiscis]GEN21708.1 replication initiation protein [Ligilactobacillus acidipiscis]